MDLNHKTSQSNTPLSTLFKATILGSAQQDPDSKPGGEQEAFSATGALEPPYDPEMLCLLLEHSNSLRQNVDAYATKIDGFGYRLEPAIDFDSEDADDKVADCITLERVAARDGSGLGEGAPQEPTPEEIAAKKKELQQLSQIERARLESFFDCCCFDHSYVDLRRRTRQDLEVTGNAYWEVLRNGAGQIVRLIYVPA